MLFACTAKGRISKANFVAAIVFSSISTSAMADCLESSQPCLVAGLIPGVRTPIVDDVVDEARRRGVPVPDVGKAVEDAVIRNIPGAKEASKSVEKLGNDVLSTVKTTAHDTIRELQKTSGDVFTTIERAHEDGARTVLKAAKDIEATYRKAWHDTAKQTVRSLNDAADAAKAIQRFQSREFGNQLSAAQKAAKQLRDGKVIDAMWTASVEKAHGTEDNFFKATQESAVINAAAQAAAATYGGPGGAAAYAAWATYKATGDVNMALRAGALAALQTQTGGGVNSMPTGTVGEVLKKSAMAGAMGGIAVAAAGGDEKAVKDAFLRSAGNVLVQAGQDQVQNYSPVGKQALDTVQCISAKDTECFSKLSYVKNAKGSILKELKTEKLDPSQKVGKWSQLDPNSAEGKTAAVIARVSKLPKSDVIPMMDNKWVMTSTLGKFGSLEADKPTVVLTYVGTDAPFEFNSSYARVGAGYSCHVPHGAKRRVVLSGGGRSCHAVYYRENSPTSEVIWRSDHDGQICASKTTAFVAELRSLGIPCQRE
jgi:hypothetical protein